MSFHDIQFPNKIAFGAIGGPRFKNEVFATAGGHETRFANWLRVKAHWDVAHGLKDFDDLVELHTFFRARRGRAYGFRFRDWSDFVAQEGASPTGTGIQFGASDLNPLNVQDGGNTTFFLTKWYPSTVIDPDPASIRFVRRITRPIAGTISIWLDGSPLGFTLGLLGQVNLSAAPGPSQVLSWDGEFDLPVRFGTDQMMMTRDSYGYHTWGEIPVDEILEQ